MANNSTLHVRIISPQQLILDTTASAVTSTNSQGPFDILPMHANFITVINDRPIIIRQQNGSKPLTYQFPLAIIYNSSNNVNIYTYAPLADQPKH